MAEYACFPANPESLMPMERPLRSTLSRDLQISAAAVPEVPVRPRLRGVSHQYAFFISLVGGILLVLLAATTRATLAAAIYAVSVSALFGVSALYHRVTWTTPVRRRMRRLDHAMIFLLIAGTYTPVGLLVLEGTLATVVLAVVWGGAVAGIVLELAWAGAPRWLGGTVYLALGWVAVVATPQLFARLGVAGGLLIVAGGLFYTVGAAIYALRRPDPVPAVFGYHEVFHLLVIAGVAAHFLAISLYALPTG
jgi:hemolysin III